MTSRYLVRAVVFLAATSGVWAAAPTARDTAASPPEGAAHYYSMTAHIRPFLLWMTREDVGGARISWAGAPGIDETLELLIGSDPERAPMGINRWGFIAERTEGATTQLTGLMTETDDRSIDAARTNATAMGASHVFRSIRGTVHDGEATSLVSRVALGADLTYRHYQALLDRLPAAGDPGSKRTRIGTDTDAGFLMSVRRLVHASAGEWQRRRRAGAQPPRRFVYAGNLYDLTLRQATVVKDAVVDSRSYGPAIEGRFEIRNQASGSLTSFTMLFGVSGAAVETPLRIVYRPRWWVELELVLVDPRAARNAFALRIGSQP